MNGTKVARRIFFWSGIYGLLALIPGYFLEKRIGQDLPPAITHPEYYYGFLGVALAFQFVFLIVSTDPVRYRPFMIACILEKFSFVVASTVLFWMDRIPTPPFAMAMIDLMLGILFILAYIVCGRMTHNDLRI